MANNTAWISRRELAQWLGFGGAAIAAGLPDRVFAQASKTTLVIGIDISDTITLDPARQASHDAPGGL
jgi:peptide/nickel transport system substrate-binding protein